MLSYFNGQYLPKEEIAISPDDRGFLFADGLYEVIRSYRGELFQLDAHIQRLNYGAREIRLKETDFSFLGDVAQRLIQENGLDGDATVYIQVTRGAAPRLHRFPPVDMSLTIYATARPFAPKTEEIKEGVNVILVPDLRWARTDVKSVGLLPNVLAQQQAIEQGASEAIFVRDGALMEGTHTNVFAVTHGKLFTQPRTHYILGGITRQVVMGLCREISIPFEERPILQRDAHTADELLITGTTTEITPVIRLDGEKIGSGEPGPITRRLQEAFFKLTKKS